MRLHPLALVPLALLGCAGALAASAALRVDQLGREPGLPNRAYLMLQGAAPPAAFDVVDSQGHVALSAPVGPRTGAWGGFDVYPLDFAVASPGWYTLRVSGAATATSLPFPIATASALFSAPLGNALSFFQNQRDGRDYLASPLRQAPAHLNDEHALVYATPQFSRDGNDLIVGDLLPTGDAMDASGGWADAGDYLKFVQTHSYAVAMMLTGLRDFPSAMGPGTQADFSAEARFGVQWLLKMWDDGGRRLRYQVGIGTGFRDHPSWLSDHDLWRLPQDDDNYGGADPRSRYLRHRPVFEAAPAGSPVSPNLAGRLAASFALCHRVFQASDPTLAQRCLLAAEHVFELADTRPGRLLTVAPYDFYPETEWRDDLEWGAAEIALALQASGGARPPGLPHPDARFYVAQAAAWAKAYIARPLSEREPLNLYDVGALAHYDLYHALANDKRAGLAVTQTDLLAHLQAQLQQFAGVGQVDPFGFGVSWGSWDTASHGIGLALAAQAYATLAGDAQWAAQARRWAANVFGANAWGLSLVVGDGAVFPRCLQHQVANLMGSLDGRGVVLAGAVVEGPNAAGSEVTDGLDGMRPCGSDATDPYAAYNGNGAEFRDDVRNYPNTEPAIDLSAGSPLWFAWLTSSARP